MAIESAPVAAKPVPRAPMSTRRMVGLMCNAVIAACVLGCVAIAVARSSALAEIRVTSLDPQAEPRDMEIPMLPVLLENAELPDYQLSLLMRNGDTLELGARPNTSAAGGLEWPLAEPVAVADIASVRLSDQDAALSDRIAEVPVAGPTITEGNYRFDFTMRHSLRVGVESFFGTPIGQAIAIGFVLAVVLIVAFLWMT